MAENWKHLYEQTMKTLVIYQDELIPGFRKQIEKLEKNQVRVRCKDCKWRCNGKDCDHPLLLSWSWGAIRNVKDDDFCSYGERKYNG